MTEHMTNLAAALPVGLHSPGVCLACLTIVSFKLESGDERKIGRAVTEIACGLWDDGLETTVSVALERAVRLEVPDADLALRDLQARAFRSTIFRAVIRRLAELQVEDMRRSDEEIRRNYVASLN
jgi:hypothetical protein